MDAYSAETMRVLVADRNALLLECISRTYGHRFSIYTATTRKRCDALLRQTGFDVTVISEKLADGPGLALLAQIAQDSPDTRRVFCARQSRLQYLKGKLGPFGLFRTLAYPIVAREFLATLVLARAGLESDSPVLDLPRRAQRPPARAVAPQPVRIPAQPARHERVRESSTRSKVLLAASMVGVFLMTLTLNARRAYPDVETPPASGPVMSMPVIRPTPNVALALEAHPVARPTHLKPVVPPVVASANPIADPSTFGSEAYEPIYPN